MTFTLKVNGKTKAVYGQRVTMLPMTANGVDFG